MAQSIQELASKFPDIIVSVKARDLDLTIREAVARAVAEGKKMAEDRILTVAEVADKLGQSERTVYRAAERGNLRLFKMEGKNVCRLSELNRYIGECENI